MNSSYETIWSTVSFIPRGKVTTYGEIARLSGFPHQARLVGYALHAIPHGSEIPWHRVVNTRGRISFPQGSSSHRQQMKLLQAEGIEIEDGKIDRAKYGWRPRSGKKMGGG